MDLEKLKQEAESLKDIDISNLTPEQLAEMINKLSLLFNQSEQLLTDTTLLEVNKEENDTNDNEGDD